MSDNADMNATVAALGDQLAPSGVEEVKLQAAPQTPDVAQAAPEGAEPAWLPDRLKRAEQGAVKRLLDELGLSGTEDLKQVVADRKAAEEAQLSELQKVQKRAEEAERQLETERSERQRIEREVRFRDAWGEAGKPAANLSAALKLVDWPEDEADFAALVKATCEAFPVLDRTLDEPAQPKPDTASAVGRRSAPAGPNPNFERWGSITRVPNGGGN